MLDEPCFIEFSRLKIKTKLITHNNTVSLLRYTVIYNIYSKDFCTNFA